MANYLHPMDHPAASTPYSPTIEDIQAAIVPWLPPPQVITYPVSAAVELISLRLGLLRAFVQSTVELYLAERSGVSTAVASLPKFIPPLEVVQLAVHVYTCHANMFAPTPYIAPLPPQRQASLVQDGFSRPYGATAGAAAFPVSMYAFPSAQLPQDIPAAVERKLCKQFRTTGLCTFGSRCLYHHSVASATDAVAKHEAESARWNTTQYGVQGQSGQQYDDVPLPPATSTALHRSKRPREPFTNLLNKEF